ncbi:MAG: hypothetical protein JSV36_09955 [Anaerolineae bacterium]|nr:MAG: hypothetical protein JSV36_09955 [Anaerolineae bacterium]
MSTHRRSTLLLTACMILVACSSPTPTPSDSLSDIPVEPRIATHQGDPRTAGYWALWNVCAPDNRAEPLAGSSWTTCSPTLASSSGTTSCRRARKAWPCCRDAPPRARIRKTPSTPLAAALLAAELNLNVGAENCPIAEEAVLSGHLVLADARFNGTGDYAAATSDDIAEAIPRLVDLLLAYNRGELCP